MEDPFGETLRLIGECQMLHIRHFLYFSKSKQTSLRRCSFHLFTQEWASLPKSHLNDDQKCVLSLIKEWIDSWIFHIDRKSLLLLSSPGGGSSSSDSASLLSPFCTVQHQQKLAKRSQEYTSDSTMDITMYNTSNNTIDNQMDLTISQMVQDLHNS